MLKIYLHILEFVFLFYISSAYRYIAESATVRGKSLIYDRNRKGPKIELCGTPVFIDCLADTLFPTLTTCVLFSSFFYMFIIVTGNTFHIYINFKL